MTRLAAHWARTPEILAASLALSAFANSPPARAAACIDYRDRLGLVGSVMTSFDARDVAVVGDYAYVADHSGLTVLDVSDPSSPRLVGSLETYRHWAMSVAADGHYAYLADADGVAVVDVSIPESPAAVAWLAMPDEARDVALDGTTLWVAGGSEGLVAVDVSNPPTPAILGALDLSDFANCVAVEDGLVCVGGEDWLHVVDGNDPGTPEVFGTAYVGWLLESVALQGGICYAGSGFPYLHVFDVTNPQAPLALSTQNFSALGGLSVMGVVTTGDLTYASVGGLDNVSLCILDTSDPSAPRTLGTWRCAGEAKGLAISGGLAYLATGNDYGVRIVDVSNPRAVPLRASVGLSAQAVAAAGSLAYVLGGGSLHVVDASVEPPAVLGALPLAGNGVAASGSYAFVTAGSAGLQVVDCTDPSAPTLLSNVPVPVWTIAASGARVYAAGNHIVHVIDVTNPAAPSVLGSLPLASDVTDLAVEREHLFAALLSASWYGSLAILDVSDPTQPTLVGSLADPTWFACSVAAAGGRAYLAGYMVPGLTVIDASNPSAPSIVASVELREVANDVAVRGGYAYVAAEAASLLVIDVAGPEAPHVAGGANAPGPVRGLALGRDGVYLADSYGPLRIAPLQCFASPRSFANAVFDGHRSGASAGDAVARSGFSLQTVHPSPFRDQTSLSFALGRSANVRIRVYDVTGRLVRSLIDTELSPGLHENRWDGKDGTGAQVAPGTYFVRLQAGGETAVRRVTRVR